MGDVAMLLPVLYAVAQANPQHEFTLLTQPFLTNLMINPPRNLEAMVIETKGEERGVWGLWRYARRLRQEYFDVCLDLHDILRTKLLRLHLMLSGVRVKVLNKNRQARAKLIRQGKDRTLSPLKPMYQAYEEVFRNVGLSMGEGIRPLKLQASQLPPHICKQYPELFLEGKALIGIAPFASTTSKTYDLERMQSVVAGLARQGKTVFLFGGRGEEAKTLQHWADTYPGVYNLADKLDLLEELTIISRLSLMLSMDSANMHFASLVGVPVLSIWCSTHPWAGFLGIGQSIEDCLQDEQLDCRPCSIFGKVRRCYKRDMPCRRSLSPEYILERIDAKLTALSTT